MPSSPTAASEAGEFLLTLGWLSKQGMEKNMETTLGFRVHVKWGCTLRFGIGMFVKDKTFGAVKSAGLGLVTGIFGLRFRRSPWLKNTSARTARGPPPSKIRIDKHGSRSVLRYEVRL